ncbi:hypothetical protein BDK51DRAFT_35179, partial [Blyttiomyces helicus]
VDLFSLLGHLLEVPKMNGKGELVKVLVNKLRAPHFRYTDFGGRNRRRVKGHWKRDINAARNIATIFYTLVYSGRLRLIIHSTSILVAMVRKSKKSVPKEDLAAKLANYAALCKQSGFPVKVAHSLAKGRHAVAAADLEVGALLCAERAATLVVSTPCVSNYCHRCIDPLAKASILGKQVTCPACGKGTWCGVNCQKQDAGRHALECAVVPKLYEIAGKHGLNPDLLRLTLSLISRRVIDSRQTKIAQGKVDSSHPEPKVDPDVSPEVAPFFCVTDLPVQRQNFEKTWMNAVSNAAKDMSALLTKSMATTETEIIDLACRINSNAHSLSDEEGKTQDTAFGLFPMGSLFFKHSCAPNCHFIGGQGILTYRTVRPIKAGEELVVSHVELYQSRAKRQEELWQTKHIRCDCSRCKVPLKKSVDRLLDGVLCFKCAKGVYLSEKDFPVKPEDVPAPAADAGKGKAKSTGEKKGENTEPEAETAVVEAEAEDLDAKLRAEAERVKAHCDECRHEVPLIQVESIRRGAAADHASLLNYFNRQLYDQAIYGFRVFLQKYKLLHPLNAELLNARVPLLTCLNAKKDNAASLGVNREILDVYERSGVLPALRQEYVELYSNLGDVLAALAEQNRPAEKKKNAHIAADVVARRYTKESKLAFRKAYDTAIVCLGKDHRRCKELSRKLGL